MDHLKRTDIELSFIKRSNVSDYLLNQQLICDTMRGSRACFQGCGVESNPFALKSTTALCGEEATQIIGNLRQCMVDHGKEINNECVAECGDYEALHDQINTLTAELSEQKQPDLRAHEALNKLSNNNCHMFKCSERCTVMKTSAKCQKLIDGNDAGGAVRYLIEMVLNAQRKDLEDLNIVDVMVSQSQPECNYLFAPNVMFNEQVDRMMVASLTAQKKQIQRLPVVQQPPQQTEQPQQLVVENGVAGDNQLDSQINLHRLQILLKKERNLDLEAVKFERELAELMRQ